MSGSFLFEESFSITPENNNRTFRNGRSDRCAHELRYDSYDLHKAARGRGFRVVTAPGRKGCNELVECQIRDRDYSNSHPNLLGFNSYFVDTLGADGLEPWHNIGQGAFVGVERLPSHAGDQAFALRADGVVGLVAVCTLPVVLSADAVEASARVYVAQRGWTRPQDELRVWADIGGPDGGISLLPNCTALATRDNVDRLNLRSAANSTANSTVEGMSIRDLNPAWPRGNMWRDASWALTESRLAEDTWAWKDLAVPLGRLEGAEVKVCVGLQSGGRGDTAVFVDRLALQGGPSADGGTPVGCAPSSVLVGTASLSSLAVPGSCGPTFDVGILSTLVGLVALLALAGFVSWACQRRFDRKMLLAANVAIQSSGHFPQA